MQIFSYGDDLLEMSNPIPWGKKIEIYEMSKSEIRKIKCQILLSGENRKSPKKTICMKCQILFSGKK